VLRVDGDGFAREAREIDAAALAFEREFEAVMQRAFGLHALADTRFGQHVHRALLEHAGANGRFDLLAATQLEHDRVDPAQMQKMGKKQARGPGANDANLSAHVMSPDAALLELIFRKFHR